MIKTVPCSGCGKEIAADEIDPDMYDEYWCEE